MRKQAWIQDPKTASTARFHWDPKSWSQDPWYFVDSGRPLTGATPEPTTVLTGPDLIDFAPRQGNFCGHWSGPAKGKGEPLR